MNRRPSWSVTKVFSWCGCVQGVGRVTRPQPQMSGPHHTMQPVKRKPYPPAGWGSWHRRRCAANPSQARNRSVMNFVRKSNRSTRGRGRLLLAEAYPWRCVPGKVVRCGCRSLVSWYTIRRADPSALAAARSVDDGSKQCVRDRNALSLCLLMTFLQQVLSVRGAVDGGGLPVAARSWSLVGAVLCCPQSKPCAALRICVPFFVPV